MKARSSSSLTSLSLCTSKLLTAGTEGSERSCLRAGEPDLDAGRDEPAEGRTTMRPDGVTAVVVVVVVPPLELAPVVVDLLLGARRRRGGAAWSWTSSSSLLVVIEAMAAMAVV